MPKVKFIITFINLVRLLFHIVFFYLNYDRCKDDVMACMSLRPFKASIFWSFCYLLTFDKTYRNLFYRRIGNAKYLMWYWLWPHPCFTLATDMKIGVGFQCIHPFSTIVNAKEIGNNFSVRNNVTIGNNKRGDRPVIGDDVSINANAVVVGNIRLGNNVVVGAGTVLTKSVPDNCVVVGNPAYILKKNGIIVKKEL